VLIDIGVALVAISASCFLVLIMGLARAAARPAPAPVSTAQLTLVARPSGPRIANTGRTHGYQPASLNLPR
jgi:hypothetical protein